MTLEDIHEQMEYSSSETCLETWKRNNSIRAFRDRAYTMGYTYANRHLVTKGTK